MTHIGSRAFVTFVFALMAAAFVWESWTLYTEFNADGLWFALASLDAQNFIFFPIAGIAVLIAFWRPATIVVDAYIRGRVVGGRPILIVGLIAIAAVSWHLAGVFGSSQTRSLYEVAPSALAADDGAPGRPDALPRAAILQALGEVRLQSRMDGGLLDYTDRCDTEQVSFAPVGEQEKYCFVAGQMATVAECCLAKTRFREAVNGLHEAAPSDTSAVHRLVMPVKIFFLLTLVGIGVMLARRRKKLRKLYGAALDKFALAVPVGAILMLLWPLMNASYGVATGVLVGDASASAYRVSSPLFSLAFAAWGLTILFYHVRSYPHNAEMVAQIAGVAVAAFGILRYDAVVAYVGRSLGAGADAVSLIVFIAIVVTLGLVVVSREADEDEEDEEPARG